MNTFRYSVPSEVQPASSSSTNQNSIEMGGVYLFLLFIFVLVANRLKRPTQQKEAQIEAQRQFLERVWQASSNLER